MTAPAGRIAARLAAPVIVPDRAWAVLAPAVLALQLALTLTHRPWLDEWQALQIALQSPTWPDLLANLRYEGHPALWYGLLRGLAAMLHSPLLVLPLAAAILAMATQAAILFAAPFARADRLLLATSEIVLFEFLTLSRSMTLGVACLVLALAVWRRGSWSWVFIALLPQCDFLFGVLSIGLVYLRWREGRLSPAGLGAWGVLALLAALTVRPAPDIVTALERHGPLRDAALWLTNIAALGLPLQMDGWHLAWNNPPPLVVAPLAGAFFAVVARDELRGRRDDAVVFGGFALVTLVFCAFVYPLAIRHLMLLALLLVLLVWRRLAAGGPPVSPLLRAWLLAGSLCGLLTAGVALVRPFDTAPEAAREIRRLGLADKDWMVFPDSRAQGIAALTGMLFDRTESRCRQDFIRWNFRTRIEEPAELYRVLAEKAARDGRFYLVSDLPVPPQAGLVQPIARVPAGLNGQAYNLYVVRPDLPESRVRLPRCNGPARPLGA